MCLVIHWQFVTRLQRNANSHCRIYTIETIVHQSTCMWWGTELTWHSLIFQSPYCNGLGANYTFVIFRHSCYSVNNSSSFKTHKNSSYLKVFFSVAEYLEKKSLKEVGKSRMHACLECLSVAMSQQIDEGQNLTNTWMQNDVGPFVSHAFSVIM